METEASAADLVERYRALRDKVAEIKERHTAELEPFSRLMDQIETVALQRMQADGSESIRTKSGTMYIARRTSFKVNDPDVLRPWILANDRLDMFENRVAKSVVEAYVEETNSLPPGVGASTDIVVNFRK